MVPLTAERRRRKVQASHLLVRDFLACFITLGVNRCLDQQSLPSRRARDQVDDDLIGRERSSVPVVGDKAEEPVFALVPFARSRREMTDTMPQSKHVRQFLERHLPQPVAIAVAASPVGRDQQLCCPWKPA